MEARLDDLETKLEDYDRVVARLEAAEDEVAKLITIKEDFGTKLKDRLDLMEAEAKNKFDEIEARMNTEGVGHRSGAGNKKQGFLPDKMMIPKVFNDDVSTWRKWKKDVSKYFDEEHEGMKAVMDEVAKLTMPITQSILEQACMKNPEAIGEKL